VRSQFEGLHELPFEVDGQLDRHLITREDILCGHFQLVLSERKHATERDARIDDIMLPCGYDDQIVALLENSAVVRWDVQEKRDHEFAISSACTRAPNHFDLLCPAKNGICHFVADDGAQVSLVNDGEDTIRADEREGCKATVLDYEHPVLGVANDSSLILRYLDNYQALELRKASASVVG